MTKRILSILTVGSLLLFACNKNDLNEQHQGWQFHNTADAQVKFINAYTALTPSAATPAAGPSVDLFVNDVKVTATPVGYGTIYPSLGGAFAACASGLVNIKAIVNRTGGNIAGDTLANGNYQLGPTTHSIILVDPNPNPTPLSPNLLVVGESVSMPAYGKFKMRFMHMVAGPADTLDLYSRRLGANIATSITYKNMSPWMELPVYASSDTLELRKTGTTTSIINLNTFSGSTSRSYTVLARGNTAVTGRTRTLSFYTSQ
ncbi:MAG: hypothetical protein U0T79_00025 [Ferruginibacter sp.]